MSLEILTGLSHKYGTAQYVLAGGGNTSCKDGNVMYVKGSGTALSTITPEQFVAMDMAKLTELFDKKYPEGDDEREAAALKDLLAARLPGEESKRPSVEALLHALFPYKYVVHTHPALVNGMTCAKSGEKSCNSLFGGDAVWIPLTKPGYILARACVDAFEGYEETPKIVFLENHGVFVAADTVDEIDALMERVMQTISGAVQRQPDLSETQADTAAAARITPLLPTLFGNGEEAFCVFYANRLTDEFVAGESSIKPLMSPYSPDHIVYCKAKPLFTEPNEDFKAAFGKFNEENGYMPRIAAVRGLGFFALGKTEKDARTAGDFFMDAMSITVYAESFGGYQTLPNEFTDFILNWEAESYRSKVSTGKSE